MAKKLSGLSPELLIHPGETLLELTQDRGMDQKELALRTGFSTKHISKVISGNYDITTRFAYSLETVFGVPASFWINLQANYDMEKMMIYSSDSVTDEEYGVLSQLSQVITYLTNKGFMEPTRDKVQKVLMLRKILRVNNLIVIPALSIRSSFRVSSRDSIDPYVLFSWVRICEMSAEESSAENELDIERLHNAIENIKTLMFKSDAVAMESDLKRILSKCGIRFRIVKHFGGAPVQGFIERLDSNEVLLCLTLRYAYAGIFWFTLFHEIAHILNDDIKDRLIDFNSIKTDEETLADEFAKEVLVNTEKWNEFTYNKDFQLGSIKAFAKEVNVPAFIIIERLQKENLIPYSQYSNEKVRYKWN